MDEPTLADDEAALAGYADRLLLVVLEALPGWVAAHLELRLPDPAPSVVDRASAATIALVEPRLRRVLAADVDEAAGSPLDVLRRAVGPVTEVLRAHEVPAPERDDFLEQRYPDDPYTLGPATFADLGPEAHDAGLVWGAARAHVHLRRRRDEGES